MQIAQSIAFSVSLILFAPENHVLSGFAAADAGVAELFLIKRDTAGLDAAGDVF